MTEEVTEQQLKEWDEGFRPLVCPNCESDHVSALYSCHAVITAKFRLDISDDQAQLQHRLHPDPGELRDEWSFKNFLCQECSNEWHDEGEILRFQLTKVLPE